MTLENNPEKTSVELQSDFSGEGEIRIPTQPRDSFLKLKFNTKAYRLIEKMTGVEHFQRLGQRVDASMGIEFLIAAIYAASRKHHEGVKHSAIVDAIEDLSGKELQTLWSDLMVIWMTSIAGVAPKLKETKSEDLAEQSTKSADSADESGVVADPLDQKVGTTL